MGSRVYRFGLLPPTVNGDAARDIIRAAHEHRKELVEIERERRAGVRTLLDEHTGVIDTLKENVKEAAQVRKDAVKLLRRTRALTRSRSETPDQVEAVRVAREREKAAVKALKERRAAQRESSEFKEAREALHETYLKQTNEKYGQSQLKGFNAWGTRALLNDAMLSVQKMPLFDGADPNDPRFPAWKREGNLGLGLNQKGAGGKGLTVEEMHSGIPGGWFQVDRLKETAASKRALRHTVLRMRVGTDPEGKPIIVEWPMIMHRLLPKGAIIRYVDVTLRRTGPREEWAVHITFMQGELGEQCGDGDIVAVAFGWHTVPGGLRVATWVDGAGNAGELVLSDIEPKRPSKRKKNRRSNAGPLASLLHVRELERVRTLNMQEALNELVVWLRAAGMPDWMKALTVRDRNKELGVHQRHDPKRVLTPEELPSQAQALAYLGSWGSEARLASLCLRWKNNRFDGDKEGFEALETWRYHDYHMWRWEASQRKGAVRRRRDIYRCFAAQLSRRYKHVIVTGANYAELVKKTKPEGEPRIAPADALRQAAAPGDLRSAIEQGFVGRAGMVSRVGDEEPKKLPEYVRWITAEGLTTTCPSCKGEAQHSAEHNTVCLSCAYARDISATWCLNALRAAGRGSDVDAMIERGRQVAADLARGPVVDHDREALEDRKKRAVSRGKEQLTAEDVGGAAE